MDPEVRRYIRESILDRAAIRHMETMLPDDAELVRWLEQTAADYEGNEFASLVIAALGAGRQVDARHLAKGAGALATGDILPQIAMKMTGDVPGYLIEAVRGAFISQRGKAEALGIAAIMYKDRGEEIPQAIYAMTRSLAHSEPLDSDALPALHGVVMFLGDEELNRFLRRHHFSKHNEIQWRKQCEAARTFPACMREQGARPATEIIAERGERYLAGGTATMRRSVPRIGRNDPCHCGSGKKYKHCCFEADRKRLRESTDIEGVTRQERQEDSLAYLTDEGLKRMTITDTLALDPDQIPSEALDTYFDRLCYWKEFDRAAEAAEKVGFWLLGEDLWETLAFRFAFNGRKDAYRRMLELRKKANVSDDRLDTMYKLAPIEDDPLKSWEWLDNEALSVLQSGDPDDLWQLAFALFMTKHKPLGILLARGVLPLLSSPEHASSLIDYVLEARTQLTLDPEDPINDIADMVSTARHETSETDAALRETRELLDLKVREAREAKEARDLALREIKRHEEELARKSSAETAKAMTPEESAALKEWRRKAEKHEQEVRERNAERTTLRRQLREKELELDAMRNREDGEARQAEADSQAVAEDELLLPDESESTRIHQPLRVIDFPRNFEQRLRTVPQAVARAALIMLARMAGGEPAAFVGAVRLKACPSVSRHRIGIDHRLLFRLLPDNIQVLDLIPRGDLERKVKVLATQYD